MIKIVRKIIDVLLIIVIIALVGYYALRVTGRAEIYNVVTGSMEEHIHAGDYILILKKNNYQVGDVITFREKENMITHRIVREENGEFITKGDANNMEDGIIKKENIIGKAVLIGGILNIVINYKFVIIGILLSMYLVGWIVDDLTKNKKVKELKEE